ncbi:ferrous iron transport protein A [Methylocella sp.]|uniref:ferrous iron transport protein A n=1 Tax=Methylocella sp. TaxID=1978226 RepID=UPI003782EC45
MRTPAPPAAVAPPRPRAGAKYRNRINPLFPLSRWRAGARVVALNADEAQARRLNDLGLRVGARLEIVRRSAGNGMLVAINDDARMVRRGRRRAQGADL